MQPGGLSCSKRSKLLAVPPHAWSSPLSTTTAFSPRGKYQKWGSGSLSRSIGDHVHEQALLLVRLRDGDLVRIEPIRLHVAGLRTVEHVVGADADHAISLLSGPRRVSLPGVDDGAREVVRERRGLSACGADRSQRDRRIVRSRRRIRVEGRDACRAVEGVAIGPAVELNGLAGDANSRAGARVHLQIRVRERRARAADAEQLGELRVGMHRNQLAASVHPRRKRRDLGLGSTSCRPAARRRSC